MSSEKTRRVKQRLDYKLYSETGRKVIKETKELKRIEEGFKNLSVMATHKIVDEEKKVCLKIDRFIDEYELEVLFDIDDIEAGIKDSKKLLESYEEIHLELKRELNDEYEETYKDFEIKSKIMTDWIKKAKLEIKKKKVQRKQEEKEEKFMKEKEEREDRLKKEEKEKEEKENR